MHSGLFCILLIYLWDFPSFHQQITSCCFDEFGASYANSIMSVTPNFRAFYRYYCLTRTTKIEKWNQQGVQRDETLLMFGVHLVEDCSFIVGVGVCVCCCYQGASSFCLLFVYASLLSSIDFVLISDDCCESGRKTGTNIQQGGRNKPNIRC